MGLRLTKLIYASHTGERLQGGRQKLPGPISTGEKQMRTVVTGKVRIRVFTDGEFSHEFTTTQRIYTNSKRSWIELDKRERDLKKDANDQWVTEVHARRVKAFTVDDVMKKVTNA